MSKTINRIFNNQLFYFTVFAFLSSQILNLIFGKGDSLILTLLYLILFVLQIYFLLLLIFELTKPVQNNYNVDFKSFSLYIVAISIIFGFLGSSMTIINAIYAELIFSIYTSAIFLLLTKIPYLFILVSYISARNFQSMNLHLTLILNEPKLRTYFIFMILIEFTPLIFLILELYFSPIITALTNFSIYFLSGILMLIIIEKLQSISRNQRTYR
ncbi:conserved hypothetical protein [Leptospira biflexa serovar Patoc strain 'Patoc 1 (Ames)']|uniref:Uncharacterized protein n=1 Tax=Leptospira biflexa serovar Patoc (strain Patoc 1 / ATCC 23582 / Paris) TaxID=456481 RepID=B0STA2_LEPBP|nr:conserved hypothetical protein [Leptospira biflexa serovar Patoc strain 'Patoc 1 (Ames)']ABZ98342.1 Hypothetical protein; putative membrane protein [Leptospira biflexa serovar Patoc strain 'Patoc 1 (Paris)']